MKLIKNQWGQGVMEYIIISSLVGVFCLIAVKQYGSVIQTRINKLRQDVVENIPTQ